MKKGKKFDNGKSRVDLIPYEMDEEIGKVLLFGVEKYGEANWAQGIDYTKLIASAKRHLGKFQAGIDIDDESGLMHVSHAATNLAMLIWMIYNRPDLDNRWQKKFRNNKSKKRLK